MTAKLLKASPITSQSAEGPAGTRKFMRDPLEDRLIELDGERIGLRQGVLRSLSAAAHREQQVGGGTRSRRRAPRPPQSEAGRKRRRTRFADEDDDFYLSGSVDTSEDDLEDVGLDTVRSHIMSDYNRLFTLSIFKEEGG